MDGRMKIVLAISVLALVFSGVLITEGQHESDAATARDWTVGTPVSQTLMPGVAYGVMPNSIPGITFSIVYVPAQLLEVIAANGTPTTPGTWVLYAFNEDQSVRDTMTITVHAADVTISTATDGHGTATGGGTYNVGDSVTLSASPNSGYEFVNWDTGEGTYSSNPYTFTVTQTFADAWPDGITYTAKFRSITPSDYSVTVYPGNYSYFYWPGGQDSTHYTSAHTYMVDAGTFFNIYWIGNSSSSGGSNPSWVTNYSDCTTMATSSGYPGTGVDYAYINSNSTFYPATAMTSSTTYTHYYTLHYNANGGSGAPSDSYGTVTNSSSEAVSKDMTISSTEPTRSGYTFLGWSTSSSATTASYQPGQTYSFSRGTTDLYAVWQESVTVTFTVNNSTYGFISMSSPYTDSVTVPAGTQYYLEYSNKMRIGDIAAAWAMTNNPPSGYTYQFDHWSSDSGTINSDMTITAYFKSSALYTVSFVSSNPLVGTVSQSTISNVPDGSGITVYNDGSLTIYGTGVTVTASSTDPLWYFDGWYIGSTQVQTGFTITADTTITAKFSSDGIQHGTAENPLNGISYSPFALWYESDKTYYVKGNSAVDLQKYIILNNTYSITNVTSGVGLTISDGSLTGNITGDATVTIQQQSQQLTTTQTITLYAIYPPCDITITAGSGGSVNINSLTVPYGSSWSTLYRELTVNGTTITATANTGYVFANWSPTGSGTITEDTAFTASFTIANYVVNFLKSPNGGGYITPGQIVTVDYGTAYTVDNTNGTIVLGGTTYTAVVNSGYSFGGWTDSGSAAVSGTITANKTFTANFTPNNYTVTFNANGGTVSPTSKTVTYNNWYGQLPTPTYIGHSFTGWYTEQTGGTQVTSGTIVTTASNHTLWAHWMEQMPDVFWWNDYVNGSATIAFNYGDSMSVDTHEMTIPLLQYDGIDYSGSGGYKNFAPTSYYLHITLSFPRTTMDVQLFKDNVALPGYSQHIVFGTWPQFALTIDAQKSTVIFEGLGKRLNDDFSFLDYSIIYTQTAFDYSSEVTNLAFGKIYHEDIEGNNTHIHFQVQKTTTYLDTYGYVMIDPTLNIYSKFPEYNDLRLNLYSFALFGDSITINGHTMTMSGSQINIYVLSHKDEIKKVTEEQHYIGKDPITGEPMFETVYKEVVIGYDEYYTIASESTPGAVNLKLTLQNIFITWNNINTYDEEHPRECYLTFVDDNINVRMGTFDPNSISPSVPDMTISMGGMWYFTTAIWEPYQATETSYSMNWSDWNNLNEQAFILVFLGALFIVFCLLTLVFHIETSWIDWGIIIGAGIITFIFLGGL